MTKYDLLPEQDKNKVKLEWLYCEGCLGDDCYDSPKSWYNAQWRDYSGIKQDGLEANEI